MLMAMSWWKVSSAGRLSKKWYAKRWQRRVCCRMKKSSIKTLAKRRQKSPRFMSLIWLYQLRKYKKSRLLRNSQRGIGTSDISSVMHVLRLSGLNVSLGMSLSSITLQTMWWCVRLWTGSSLLKSMNSKTLTTVWSLKCLLRANWKKWSRPITMGARVW